MKKISLYTLLCLMVSVSESGDNDLIFLNGFEPCDSQSSCCKYQILFNEPFPDGNHNNWGGDWVLPGFQVDTAEIVNGQARFLPLASNYSLARINHSLDAQDVEVNFTVIFENATTQGVGFYVRSNGGYLNQTFPTGQGYAVFVEKFNGGMPGLGLWYENDGNEIPFIRDYSQNYELNDESPYRVRFQVYQINSTQTQLRAKLWPAGQPEPVNWHVSHTDNFAPLQNLSGDIAVDSWNTQQNGQINAGTRIDDIEIKQLCNPIMNYSEIETLQSGLQFAEGPTWHNNQLLFSDITANTTYQWDETSGLLPFNADSGQANGLYSHNGSLFAAEHLNRQISINDGNGAVTYVDNYQGNAFNSPNDLVMSNSGVLYFTDPDYGLNGRPREIAFNGVYRYASETGVVAEVMGNELNNKPNGIAISHDQESLYWSDTQSGELNRMSINSDGSLSDLSTIANGLTIPDGICIDPNGNIYVATWNGAIEVFSVNHEHWGAITIPENSVTNCAFAGDKQDQLIITSTNSLYRFLPIN